MSKKPSVAVMGAGLLRIAEVANRISAGTADRGVAHATSGIIFFTDTVR